MRSLYKSVKMSRAAKRLEIGKKEEGFTLIELMIVVLIIAILVAVAVPTFLGARKSAQRSAAAQTLRNVVQTGRDAYTTNSAFSGTLTDYQNAEPALTFGASTIANNYNSVAVDFDAVSATTGTIQAVEYAAATSGGECLYVLDIPSDQAAVLSSGLPTSANLSGAGTYYAKGQATKGVCTIAQVGAGFSWSTTPVAS